MLRAEVGEGFKYRLQNLLEMDASSILKDEREFNIFIDGKEFYSEPLFPILELARACYNWLQFPADNFEYVTMESDDNPMLQFATTGGGFLISSPWQKFSSPRVFAKREVIDFFEQILLQIICG